MENTVSSKTVKIFLPIALILGSLLVAGVLVANRPSNTMVEAQERVVTIDAAEVVLEDIRISVLAQGTVTPHRETSIVSEVAGKILKVSPSFNAGGYVAEGEVLIEIDDGNYQANLMRARASVESAESALATEKGRAEVAYNEWQKLPKNSQRSQDATDLYLRKPQLEQAQAQLLAAQADLQKAQDDLERTIIRAPYDALIRSKRSDLGQYVSPGTPLAEVFAVDYAEVRLAIPQGKLAYLDLPGVSGYDTLEQAPMVDLYTDVSGEVTHWTARLHRTEGVFDERSRVLFTVARVSDPYALDIGDTQPLRMGTFVKANIVGKLFEDLVALPRHVIRAGNMVWVVDDQMRLRNRKVSTLRTEGKQIYVNSGLQEGDLVSLTNISGAIPGTSVQINKRSSTQRGDDKNMEAAVSTEQQTSEPKRAPDQTSNLPQVGSLPGANPA
jgi:RND family efflux transporter MFP subunit